MLLPLVKEWICVHVKGHSALRHAAALFNERISGQQKTTSKILCRTSVISPTSDNMHAAVRAASSRNPASLAAAYSACSCSVHVLVINESLLIPSN